MNIQKAIVIAALSLMFVLPRGAHAAVTVSGGSNQTVGGDDNETFVIDPEDEGQQCAAALLCQVCLVNPTDEDCEEFSESNPFWCWNPLNSALIKCAGYL